MASLGQNVLKQDCGIPSVLTTDESIHDLHYFHPLKMSLASYVSHVISARQKTHIIICKHAWLYVYSVHGGHDYVTPIIQVCWDDNAAPYIACLFKPR